jgi:Flp pilus assembly protein TadD
MGQTEEAIRDFTEAISLDPQNPVHYLNRAISYRYLNQVERSIADARIAQQLGLQVDSALLK